MIELVVYTNDEETFVCHPDDEDVLLGVYFGVTSGGRDIKDFYRIVGEGPVASTGPLNHNIC